VASLDFFDFGKRERDTVQFAVELLLSPFCYYFCLFGRGLEGARKDKPSFSILGFCFLYRGDLPFL
jgi:hypothetical protein